MPPFSQHSLNQLGTVHPDLRALFTAVNEQYPCTIIEGHRSQTDQHAAFISGKSKLDFPFGKHNGLPSMAVDVAPDPVSWDNRPAFYHFAGYVLAIAHSMGLDLRWGGNWNGGPIPASQDFNDLPHFELVQDMRIESPLTPVNERG